MTFNLGKSIIEIDTQEESGRLEGMSIFTLPLGIRQDNTKDGNWDLTPFTKNQRLSLDLHTLVQVNGVYDDTTKPNNNDTGLRALFSSQNNTASRNDWF